LKAETANHSPWIWIPWQTQENAVTRQIEFPSAAPEKNRSAIGDWSLILVPGVIWGASFLFIAEGLNAVAPMGLTLLRIAIGFAALSCFPAAWKPIQKRDWISIAWLGVLWMAFPLAMFPFAEQRISSAVAGMLNGAVPLTTAIIATVIARKLPSRGVLIGLGIGLVGVVLMAIPDLGDASSAAGIAMVTVACISYGFAPNIARPLQQKYGALPVIWRAQIVALVLTLPLGFGDVMESTWTWAPALSLLGLGALGTGVAHVVMATASGRIGATKAAATAFLIPPVALVLGVLVRNESVAMIAVIGGALCVAGAWVIRRANTPPATPVVAPMAKAAGLLLALTLVSPTTAFAQDAIPLARLSGAIQLDGRSDDAAWQSVAPFEMQVHLPNFGAAPSERTITRVAYDADALYVMIDALESHAGGVRASSMLRDDDAPGDFLNILLDTFGDRQNAVNFSTTPGGQRNDWSISNDAQAFSNFSPGWNGVWDVAVVVDAEGWHAEYRIPFSTLRFKADEGRIEFAMSINRLVAHSNERQTFPLIDPAAPLAVWKPSRFQRVSIEGINPVRNVRFIPYVVAGEEGSRSPDPALDPWARNSTSEIGADFKVALTPNLTLDLTANTDFAETEVDDQRINLTRFPLLFPERRPFFVERAGTYEVRTGETDFLFNSRRVGLTADGRPVRLLGGARLVGQVNGWDVGFFDAQTDETDLSARENLGVLRLRRQVLNARSWAGVMMTSRIAEDSSQQAFAADGDLYLGGDDYLSFGAAVLAGDAMVGEAKGVLPRGALRLLVERRRNRDFWYRAGLSTTGSQYAPALGYVERLNAIRPMLELGYGRQVTPAGHVVRTSVVGTGQYRNAAGTLEQSHAGFVASLEQPSGASWTFVAARQEDDLLAGFSPTPATTIPAGRYTASWVTVSRNAATGPKVAVSASARVGEFFDGTLTGFSIAPEWRASRYFRIGGDLQVDRIEFETRNESQWSQLGRVRLLAAASPRLTFTAVLQSNSLAKAATANLRLRYNTSEGNDLWIVYGQLQNLDVDRVSPALPGTGRSGLLVKVTRRFGS
jgi:drug/metabolite transporter (DMT)-like permease